MVRSFILVCILLFPYSAFTQRQENTELNKRLDKAKSATDSSLIIRGFVLETGAGSSENAFKLIQTSKNLLKNESDKKIWADYYLNAGIVYYNYNEVDKALENFIKSYDYYKSGNFPEKRELESRFSHIYTNMGQYSQAEVYMKKLYRHALTTKDTLKIATQQVNLGWLYLQYGIDKEDSTKFKPSLDYLRKGYRVLQDHGSDMIT